MSAPPWAGSPPTGCRPCWGDALYFLLGINRVTRRALKLARRRGRGGKHLAHEGVPAQAKTTALLAQIGERVTGRPLTPGNSLAIFTDGDATYPQMLAAIGAAQSSIAMASYIFRNDEAWLIGAHITPLTSASTHVEADPVRMRKLLLHRR